MPVAWCKLNSFVASLVAGILSFGLPSRASAANGAEECSGCHGLDRDKPPRSFATGMGAWSDSQCYGCHAEINEIAVAISYGKSDQRVFGLPVTDERLRSLAKESLPYHDVPQNLHVVANGSARIDLDRLVDFLRRPSRRGTHHYPRMMAFPDISRSDLSATFPLPSPGSMAISVASSDSPATSSGKRIWETRCQSCHALEQPSSGVGPTALSLYSADWVFRYANGKDSTDLDVTRTMPPIKVSPSEAGQLFYYFGQARAENERAVDLAVTELDRFGKAPSVRLTTQTNGYFWGPFYRDAGCVHCHSAPGRARDHFDPSPEGLQSWLAKNDPVELWRRLEIREIESRYGVGSKRPGMPMTGAPLPRPLRRTVLRWILDGCKNQSGTRFCDHRK